MGRAGEAGVINGIGVLDLMVSGLHYWRVRTYGSVTFLLTM